MFQITKAKPLNCRLEIKYSQRKESRCAIQRPSCNLIFSVRDGKSGESCPEFKLLWPFRTVLNWHLTVNLATGIWLHLVPYQRPSLRSPSSCLHLLIIKSLTVSLRLLSTFPWKLPRLHPRSISVLLPLISVLYRGQQLPGWDHRGPFAFFYGKNHPGSTEKVH